MTFQEELANNIRATRLDRGMTQEDLADLVGVKRNTISQYETKRRYISLEMVVRISIALRISLADLIPEYTLSKPVQDSRQTSIFDALEEGE